MEDIQLCKSLQFPLCGALFRRLIAVLAEIFLRRNEKRKKLIGKEFTF